MHHHEKPGHRLVSLACFLYWEPNRTRKALRITLPENRAKTGQDEEEGDFAVKDTGKGGLRGMLGKCGESAASALVTGGRRRGKSPKPHELNGAVVLREKNGGAS